MHTTLEIYRAENGDVVLVSELDGVIRNMVLTPNATAQLILALQSCLARMN